MVVVVVVVSGALVVGDAAGFGASIGGLARAVEATLDVSSAAHNLAVVCASSAALKVGCGLGRGFDGEISLAMS